jgi:hypothetical protein
LPLASVSLRFGIKEFRVISDGHGINHRKLCKRLPLGDAGRCGQFTKIKTCCLVSATYITDGKINSIPYLSLLAWLIIQPFGASRAWQECTVLIGEWTVGFSGEWSAVRGRNCSETPFSRGFYIDIQ